MERGNYPNTQVEEVWLHNWDKSLKISFLLNLNFIWNYNIFFMWILWLIVKLLKYSRVVMMQTYKSLDLFFCKPDVIRADFFASVLWFFFLCPLLCHACKCRWKQWWSHLMTKGGLGPPKIFEKNNFFLKISLKFCKILNILIILSPHTW